MSEDTRVTGAILIDPPLTWAEAAAEPWLNIRRNYNRDAVLRVVEEPVDTPDGPLLRRHVDAIIPERQYQNAYHLLDHVQQIVDKYGTGRTFAGHLDCMWRGDGSRWRITVVDGRAVHQEPRIIWPGDDVEAESAVARVRALCDAAEADGGDTFADPTPIPGWTTLVRGALDGEVAW